MRDHGCLIGHLMNIYHKILEVVHVGIRVQKRGDSITYRLKYGELEKQCITMATSDVK